METAQIVGGRFVVERRVGSGGSAHVFRATDNTTGEIVAIKVLRDADAEHTERFLREAHILAALRAPTIARYVAHGRTDGHAPYLAMEWLEGEDLAARLARGALPMSDVLTVARRVATALARAHAAGIVHRDVKPSNLFLRRGLTEELVLIDFGVARVGKLTRAWTESGVVLGTPSYMAPEQVMSAADVDGRADLFSLGCVLYECLTGHRAFAGDHMLAVLTKIVQEILPPASTRVAGVPRYLDDLLLRLTAKEADERYEDAGAVLRALDEATTEQPRRKRKSARALTTDEQRLVCVLLVRPKDPREAPTLSSSVESTVTSLIGSAGGAWHALPHGASVVSFVGEPSATDLASKAARVAITLSAVMPTSFIALATGRGDTSAPMPMGAAIDRAASIIARAATSAKEAREDTLVPSRVRVDEVTAGLLDVSFALGRDALGAFVEEERGLEDAQRTVLGTVTPFVGRDREAAILRATLDECAREGVARAVIVTGPAGIGKTRLRQEFVRGIAGDVDLLLARGDPLGAGAPLALVSQAIRRAANLREGVDLSRQRRALLAWTRARVGPANAHRVAEFLGEIVGAPFDASESRELVAARRDPRLMSDQLERAWLDLIDGACRTRPVLFVLEDLHCGDLPTIRFVDAALRVHRERPLMVAAFARPEVSDMFPNLWASREATHVPLSELSKRACAELVRGVLGEAIAPSRVEPLVERAGGNAFYLEELIRAAANGNTKTEALPDTVLAMAQARIERLDDDARHLLRAASVFGPVFWRGGARALLGAATGRLARVVDALLAAEVIVRRATSRFPGEEELMFRHAIVRDAAYAMLTTRDQSTGHRLAGEWLEQRGAHDAAALATHFDRGGDLPRACRYHASVAEEALARNDFAAALAACDLARREGDPETSARVSFVAGESHKWRAEWPETIRCAEAALSASSPGSRAWLRAANQLATASSKVSAVARLVAIAASLRAMRPAEGVRFEYVAAAFAAGAHLYFVGRHADAADTFAAMTDAANEGDGPEIRALVFQARALGATFEGDVGVPLEAYASAIVEFERAGNRRAASLQRANLGHCLIEAGAYDEAADLLERTIASAEEQGLSACAALATHNLGVAKLAQGQLVEAEAHLSRVITDAATQGNAPLEAVSHAYLAMALARQGRLDASAHEAALAQQKLSTKAKTGSHALALLALTEIRMAERRFEDAASYARENVALLDELGGVDSGESKIRITLALALEAIGDGEGAARARANARSLLLARAARIRDAAHRAAFLARVPENAATLAPAPASSKALKSTTKRPELPRRTRGKYG